MIGVPDPKWGEAVKAVVVLQPGAERRCRGADRAVRASKGAVQAPKTVDFVDALPLSPLGKPDKKALRLRLLGLSLDMNHRDVNVLRERLAAFLPNGERITGLRPLTAGHSNETYVIEGLDLILRLASAAPSFESHGILTQARIYDEVSRFDSAPPVPRIHVIHEDAELLGAPFFVMEKIEGVSVDDYTLPEWFTSLSDEQRSDLCQHWIAAIGSIATVAAASTHSARRARRKMKCATGAKSPPMKRPPISRPCSIACWLFRHRDPAIFRWSTATAKSPT